MFFDLTRIEAGRRGTPAPRTGTALDVRRFSLSLDHAFSRGWSLHLVTDYQDVAGAGASGPFAKKAYVQYRFAEALVLRAGSADLPWVPFVESAYGMRYVENTLVDRLKFGTSADWGVHASGEFAGRIAYAVAALNGSGYRNPGRSGGPDFEGRVSFSPAAGTVIGVGAYSGTLGKAQGALGVEHTANRVDAMAAYAAGNIRFGVEYFRAENWNNVLTLASDQSSGWSAWGSVGLGREGITLFGRHDQASPGRTLDPTLRDTYYNVGVEFPIARGVKLAAAYKHNDRSNDAGSIALETDEFGVWGEFRF